MHQERNDHSLIRDIADKLSGYLNNMSIMEMLSHLALSGISRTKHLAHQEGPLEANVLVLRRCTRDHRPDIYEA
jgi:hypothetical protein